MPLPPDPRDAFVLPDDVLYLDTASNAPRLRTVHEALLAAWDAGIAPWRLDWDAWVVDTERVRTLASRLFHADHHADPDGVALVPSVAHAMSMVAANWPLRAGDTVAMVEGEFPSARLPWQARCADVGASLLGVPRDGATHAVLALLEGPAPALLVLSESHWRDGRRLDLDRVATAARDAGVPVVLDLSQSLGVLPCDVARWRPAFAMSVGYKWWLANKGLCALWVDADWRERARPLELHWQGRAPERPWAFDGVAPAPFRTGARRFDGGEVAEPLRLAITAAALEQVLDWTPAAIAARLGAWLDALRSVLSAAGFGDWCVGPPSPHLLGLAPPASAVEAVRAAFARSGIVCIERDGVFRLAPHVHVRGSDVQRVVDAVRAAG